MGLIAFSVQNEMKKGDRVPELSEQDIAEGVL